MRLTVSVPADANVMINGKETKITGTTRTYVTRNLRSDRQYKYEIRAEVERDGQLRSESRVVYVKRDDAPQIAFNFESQSTDTQLEQVAQVSNKNNSEENPTTTLRLHVPANAKVMLDGKKTTTPGSVRVYRTTTLAHGERWSDYKVRVELERDGRLLSKEMAISMWGGQTRDLEFSFDEGSSGHVALKSKP